MRHDRGERGVEPQRGARALRVQQHERRDAHQRAVAGALGAAAVPGRHALLAVVQELPHRLAEAEDRARGEAGGEVVGIEFAALEQALERPERELGVVGGQAHAASAGVRVRQVVADLAVTRRRAPRAVRPSLVLPSASPMARPISMPRMRSGATGPFAGSFGPCSRASLAGRWPSVMMRATSARWVVTAATVSQIRRRNGLSCGPARQRQASGGRTVTVRDSNGNELKDGDAVA